MATSTKSNANNGNHTSAIPESAITDAIADLQAETARVKSAIDTNTPDKSFQALSRALASADAALVDNASRVPNVDSVLTPLRAVWADVKRKSEPASIDFTQGDNLVNVVRIYASLARLNRLGKFRERTFTDVLAAWDDLPRHKGRNEDAYPFTIELVRDGKVIRTLGARAHKVYPSNLKTALEAATARKLARSDDQWKHARAALRNASEANVYSVTVRRAS